jgi:hypothetical protein
LGFPTGWSFHHAQGLSATHQLGTSSEFSGRHQPLAANFLAPLPGRKKTSARGVFAHTFFTFLLLCFILFYLPALFFYQKPQKIRILGSCFYLFTFVLLKWVLLKTPSCVTLLARTIVILSALLLHHLLLLQTFMRLSLLC